VKPVDTTGAGDAFVGAFAFGLMQGLSAELAAKMGTAAASLSVTRLGAQASYPTKLEAAEIFSTVSTRS
ncbi:MAG: PfkB family carbohydrate kinase, partial [Actinomycetota bacterium]|nr:PfkB family carbohydrate kinase [Actinomycetota bacterium]